MPITACVGLLCEDAAEQVGGDVRVRAGPVRRHGEGGVKHTIVGCLVRKILRCLTEKAIIS